MNDKSEVGFVPAKPTQIAVTTACAVLGLVFVLGARIDQWWQDRRRKRRARRRR